MSLNSAMKHHMIITGFCITFHLIWVSGNEPNVLLSFFSNETLLEQFSVIDISFTVYLYGFSVGAFPQVPHSVTKSARLHLICTKKRSKQLKSSAHTLSTTMIQSSGTSNQTHTCSSSDTCLALGM